MALEQIATSYREMAAQASLGAFVSSNENRLNPGSDVPIEGVARPIGYAEILKGRQLNFGEVQHQTLAGLEEFFAKLLSYWNLSAEQGASLVGYSPQNRFQVERVLSGLAKFSTVDERDRVLLLFDIRKLLAGLFRNRDVENRWLREPNPGLDGESPMEVLMSRTFPNLLKVKQFIEHLAGV